MFIHVSFSHFVFAIILFHLGEGSVFRIIGGRNASTLEFPYQAELEEWLRHACGGSIITEKFVLTAAHCVKHIAKKSPIPSYILRVRVGNDIANTNGSIHEVDRIIIHEMYDDNALIDQYDIALLKLKDPLVFTNRVKAVELASSEAKEGEMAWVTGFGRQEIMRGAYVDLPHLMAIQLPIIELKKCRNLLSHVADDMICAGRKTGNYDACTGDSGGPMVTKKGQVGIVAWGLGCGREGVPGVYTSVAYHKRWIAKRVQENTE